VEYHADGITLARPHVRFRIDDVLCWRLTVCSSAHAEQVRLTKNYVAEVCAVQKISRAANWTCDVTATPPKLHVPMLPCNFIPVHARLYTGKALVATDARLQFDRRTDRRPFDCSSTALRPLGERRYDRGHTCCVLMHCGLNK